MCLCVSGHGAGLVPLVPEASHMLDSTADLLRLELVEHAALVASTASVRDTGPSSREG